MRLHHSACISEVRLFDSRSVIAAAGATVAFKCSYLVSKTSTRTKNVATSHGVTRETKQWALTDQPTDALPNQSEEQTLPMVKEKVP